MTAEDTENKPTQATAGEGGTSTAPKKKRNRKKKNKKNKNSEGGTGGNAGGETEAVDDEQAKMNPHACLRTSLMNEGFKGEQIDKAMEEMWDKQLAYDEYDAVLKYLKSGGKDDSTSSNNKKKPTKANDAVATKVTPKQDSQNGHSDTAVKNDTNQGVEESKEETPVVEDEKPVEEEEEVKPEDMSMASKLDLVAGFENFTDAAFALTEWVLKAAKPRELDELCVAKTTSALPTIIRRSITEAEDQATFDSAVLPSVIRLVVAILTKCGISSDAVNETRDCFQSVIKLARKATIMQQDQGMEGDLADKVARFVVSRTSLAADESKISATDSCQSMQELEGEINSLTSSLASSPDNGITELLAKRDLHRMAAKKSSVVARLALQSLGSGSSVASGAQNGHSSLGSREAEMEKSEIFRALLGDQGKENLDRNRLEMNDLKAKLQEGESEHIKGLRQSIDEFQSERTVIAQRIAEMRQNIEKLEVYDAELCSKIVDMESEIEDDYVSRNEESNRISAKMEETTKIYKFGNSVTGLVDLLKNYDDSLDKAVNGPAMSFSETENLAEVASSKMDMFLFRNRNYFVTEAECVDCLRGRIQASQKEIGELKIEIAEIEGLGMTTTVGQMEDALKNKQELIVKESAIVERYLEEAAVQLDTVLSRLEQYKSTPEGEAGGLSLSQDSALQVIATSCISRLGIQDADRLKAYVNISTGNGHVPLQQQNITPMSTAYPTTEAPPASLVAPIAAPILPVATEQATIMPKFTWAAAGGAKTTGDVAGKKTSLLDIQREELQSKTVT